MSKIVERWHAVRAHWHQGACFEIIVEQVSAKWLVTYLDHGEQHACIGFDSEEEAHGDVHWLLTMSPPELGQWRRVV